jgi:RNA polymerase sigma factor (sigma-70 family)
MKKIFGFALSKMMNTDKAEELASRITFDVYRSLLKAETVHNIDGYIYRVARNVYARFVDEEARGRTVSLDEVRVPCDVDFTGDFEKDETYIRLRREVSYLGKTQRDIVIMHYFQRLKQHEIAKRLNIPLGTVKWHLHDAKNSMKEGLKMTREKGILSVKPIRLTSMGHCGSPGSLGDTNDFLKRNFTQNIAYAAYHEAKTINEIAQELGVSPVFVEDEVLYLEEYGFMDEQPGRKYLTNIYITEPTKESDEKEHELCVKTARLVCEQYIPLVEAAVKKIDPAILYIPGGDMNFLLWTAVMYACCYKLATDSNENGGEMCLWAEVDKFLVKRKDGGEYIAHARVEADFELSYDTELYGTCGNMHRGVEKYPAQAWQFNTYYDSRTNGWRDNLHSDYEYLYEVISGKIKKEDSQIEKFKRLYDKGYLIPGDNGDFVNMLVVNVECENDFRALLPGLTDGLREIGRNFDREMFNIRKALYPKHMQALCKVWSSSQFCNGFFVAHVLEQLAADGILKPLTDTQKHSVNTIMFSDVLPK